MLLLHEGPEVPGTNLRGNAVIREAVEPWSRLLVICGHCHWDAPLATLARGTQVLNVDARAVLLRRVGTCAGSEEPHPVACGGRRARASRCYLAAGTRP